MRPRSCRTATHRTGRPRKEGASELSTRRLRGGAGRRRWGSPSERSAATGPTVHPDGEGCTDLVAAIC